MYFVLKIFISLFRYVNGNTMVKNIFQDRPKRDRKIMNGIKDTPSRNCNWNTIFFHRLTIFFCVRIFSFKLLFFYSHIFLKSDRRKSKWKIIIMQSILQRTEHQWHRSKQKKNTSTKYIDCVFFSPFPLETTCSCCSIG